MICIFVFHDLKANKFINPFFSQNMHDALRSVQTMLRKPGSLLSDYPEDYVLYQSGTIEEDDGRLTPFPDPLLIQTLLSLKGGAA